MQRLTEYKKYFLHVMVGSLIAGAFVGIVSILIGSFSDTSGKVILSLVLLMAHAIFSFSVIPDGSNQERIKRLSFFYEILFVLVSLSLFTSLFATWSLLEGELAWQLYLSYFSIGFASLIISVLSLFRDKSRDLSMAASTGIASTAILLVFVLTMIFAYDSLDDFYYRLTAVVAIVATTSTVITATLYKLYLQKHPEEKNILSRGKGTHGFLRFLGWLILIYFGFNLLFGLLYLINF